MLFAAIAGATHFVAGLALGFMFRISGLIIAIGVSAAAMIVVCSAAGVDLLWPLVIAEVSLQLGYGAGSFAASLLAAKAAVRDKVSTDPDAPGSLVLRWLWAQL